MSDVLIDMFDDMRRSIPTAGRYQEFPAWIDAIAQMICFLPTCERQGAGILLVANDIAKDTGVPFDSCVFVVKEAVEKRKVVTS